MINIPPFRSHYLSNPKLSAIDSDIERMSASLYERMFAGGMLKGMVYEWRVANFRTRGLLPDGYILRVRCSV